MKEWIIRPEAPSDFDSVEEIHRAAFGRPDEAHLVSELRKRAKPTLSLVAEASGSLLGHVMFSPVTIEGPKAPPPSVGLAPLAVMPDAERQGIGSALVRTGLRDCLPMGWRVVFLLGDPGYYFRFGFELAAAQGLRYESEAFDAGFQFIELVPGASSGMSGWVRYHEAFAHV
ncbi:MAG: N-acetyltransferase [Myxococcota bacterium]